MADFDGDGAPEIGVAALAYYSVFDTDGTVMWSNPTNDQSSSVTGSSVFDFDRDGADEVVYADQFNLFVVRRSHRARYGWTCPAMPTARCTSTR